MKSWTKAEEKRFAELYCSAKSVFEIAIILGRTEYSLRKRANHLGLHRDHCHWTPERDAELLALHVAGMPTRAIARRLKRTFKAIQARIGHIKRRS